MRFLNLIFSLVLGIFFIILASHNIQSVEFNYIFGKLNLPLVVLLLISFSVGVLITLIYFGLKALFWRLRAKSLNKQLKQEHEYADDALVRAEFKADKSA